MAGECELGRDWELVATLPACVQPREAGARAAPWGVTGGHSGCKASLPTESL